MYPTTSMLEFQISTVISLETTLPYVVIHLNDIVNELNVATLQMSPAEAKALGTWIIEGGQAAIDESLMVISMRAHKVPEAQIAEILTTMRDLNAMLSLDSE